ncbi:MAG: hypothetical protein ACRDNS_06450, partial [Trebonia sp.]
SGVLAPGLTAAGNKGVGVASGLLGMESPGQGAIKIPGPAISASYGKAISTSLAQVDQGASISAGTVTISAHNDNDFEVSATSTSVAPGTLDPQQAIDGGPDLNKSASKSGTNQGQGIGVAVSQVQSYATTQVNGSVDATGSAAVTALADNVTNNTIAETVIRNTAVWETKKANLNAFRSKAGNFGLAAGVAYVSSTNDSEAHIGPSAQLTVHGDLSLTSDAEDPIRAAAIGAGLQETQVAIGGAVSIATENNTSNASVQSTVGVNVGGDLSVDSQSNIPLNVLPLQQYEQLREFITNETTPGSALFSSGDFVDAPSLVSDLASTTPDPLSAYLWSQFTTAEQNTLRGGDTETPHLTLTDSASRFYQRVGDQLHYTLI